MPRQAGGTMAAMLVAMHEIRGLHEMQAHAAWKNAWCVGMRYLDGLLVDLGRWGNSFPVGSTASGARKKLA